MWSFSHVFPPVGCHLLWGPHQSWAEVGTALLDFQNCKQNNLGILYKFLSLRYFVITTENRLRRPQREMFASECRSGNPAVFQFHENIEPSQEGAAGRWDWGKKSDAPKQFLRAESCLMLYIWMLFSSLSLRTLFISQSIKTMCFWFVSTQLVIKILLDVEEIHVDSWNSFLPLL